MLKYAIIIYALMACISYGHSAANTKVVEGDKSRPEQEQRAGNGMMAGMMWPLYWAQVAFEEKE